MTCVPYLFAVTETEQSSKERGTEHSCWSCFLYISLSCLESMRKCWFVYDMGVHREAFMHSQSHPMVYGRWRLENDEQKIWMNWCWWKKGSKLWVRNLIKLESKFTPASNTKLVCLVNFVTKFNGFLNFEFYGKKL